MFRWCQWCSVVNIEVLSMFRWCQCWGGVNIEVVLPLGLRQMNICLILPYEQLFNFSNIFIWAQMKNRKTNISNKWRTEKTKPFNWISSFRTVNRSYQIWSRNVQTCLTLNDEMNDHTYHELVLHTTVSSYSLFEINAVYTCLALHLCLNKKTAELYCTEKMFATWIKTYFVHDLFNRIISVVVCSKSICFIWVKSVLHLELD